MKPFTRLESFSTFLNSHQKILQKILIFNFRSIKSSFQSIECSLQSIEQESNIDRDIQRLQDYFLTIFNWLSQRFDQSKMLNFEFSLRKFHNLNFHFMKQYSPNSNIIITTYLCICLYIQHYLQNSLVSWLNGKKIVLINNPFL